MDAILQNLLLLFLFFFVLIFLTPVGWDIIKLIHRLKHGKKKVKYVPEPDGIYSSESDGD